MGIFFGIPHALLVARYHRHRSSGCPPPSRHPRNTLCAADRRCRPPLQFPRFFRTSDPLGGGGRGRRDGRLVRLISLSRILRRLFERNCLRSGALGQTTPPICPSKTFKVGLATTQFEARSTWRVGVHHRDGTDPSRRERWIPQVFFTLFLGRCT